MNLFAGADAAERYARGRPYFHPLVMERLRPIVAPVDLLRHGLDIGCGTGQSSVALTDLVEDVLGIDSAEAMIERAQAHPRVRYLAAPAENLPVPDGSIDVITTALAFHWFDRPRFLREVMRTLGPSGWFINYNDGFSGELEGNAAYGEWNRQHYVRRFPTPPRDTAPFTDDDAAAVGLATVARQRFAHEVSFDAAALADYLCTQTNVGAAIAEGREAAATAYRWLVAAIAPFFETGSAQCRFYCSVDVFRRTP